MLKLSFSIFLTVSRHASKPDLINAPQHLVPAVVLDEPKKPALWKKIALHLVVVLIAHGLFQSAAYMHDIIQT